ANSRAMRKKDKTKFPVARIKKIMQMDEEVGKMAQATPVLISKSLELFMQSIVEDVVKQARVCNARKVTVTHLKRCVESTESYDFLKDIVEGVVDDGDGGGAEACVAKVAALDA
ncbi:H2A super protein, partial [Coemansia sp. RSA 2607]